MAYDVPIDDAARAYPEYQFIRQLTPSEQKAAFHVRDADGRDLCLKLISPNYDIDRVNREIESLQEVDHPNIVRIMEYLYSSRPGDRRHHVLEEYVDGSDLTELLADAPLPLARAASLFAAIFSGLDALRQKHIVHRDLKPANIRVRTTGEPVIIDFGLARRLKAPDLTRTAQGAAIGTPAYFAPEQFRGDKRDIDHRTDLFTTGVLLYTATVGHHPFFRERMRLADLEAAICDSPSHLESSSFMALPNGWQIIIRRLLAKHRVERPATAAQVTAMIKKVEGNEHV